MKFGCRWEYGTRRQLQRMRVAELMTKVPRVASVLALASIVLVSVPWDQARASDGTTTTGYVFIFGLVLVGLGALGVLLLGGSLRRAHRTRLGREATREDVPSWQWILISSIPRPSPDAHHSGGVFDLHAGGRGGDVGASNVGAGDVGSVGGGDLGGGGGDGG